MSEHKHDFHLVSPSALPILCTIALTVMSVGAIMYMHNKSYGIAILALGTIAVLATLYKWWLDVIVEGDKDKAHTKVVQQGLRIGMILFIASETMLFGAFFASFFKASLLPVDIVEEIWPVSPGAWPPEGIVTFNPWGIPFINTIILLISSITATIAHHASAVGNNKKTINFLAITITLGLIFTSMQVYEYFHAGFGFTDGIYASNFYMATGLHGLHVVVGTIFFIICLLRAVRGMLTPEAHLGLQFASWYWHFVDVIWVFLFIWIYWWGS